VVFDSSVASAGYDAWIVRVVELDYGVTREILTWLHHEVVDDGWCPVLFGMVGNASDRIAVAMPEAEALSVKWWAAAAAALDHVMDQVAAAVRVREAGRLLDVPHE
jgi:hypothetical protein